MQKQSHVLSVKIRVISVISGKVLVPSLFSQKPYPPIYRAMIGAKERQEGGRIYIVVHYIGIFPIQDIIHAYARCPAISVKREFSFHRGVQVKELRKAELPGP